MHPPTFAPRPASVRQLPPEPAGDSDQLWENLDWLQEDVPADPDESEEDGEDAVPTEQMPVPAPVPLESYMPVRGGRHRTLGMPGAPWRRWPPLDACCGSWTGCRFEPVLFAKRRFFFM